MNEAERVIAMAIDDGRTVPLARLAYSSGLSSSYLLRVAKGMPEVAVRQVRKRHPLRALKVGSPVYTVLERKEGRPSEDGD